VEILTSLANFLQDASRSLVYGMAKQGEGQAEFIKSGDNMDEKVMRQLNRALKPALTNVRINLTYLTLISCP
jgi:hypothetical protein